MLADVFSKLTVLSLRPPLLVRKAEGPASVDPRGGVVPDDCSHAGSIAARAR